MFPPPHLELGDSIPRLLYPSPSRADLEKKTREDLLVRRGEGALMMLHIYSFFLTHTCTHRLHPSTHPCCIAGASHRVVYDCMLPSPASTMDDTSEDTPSSSNNPLPAACID